MIIDNIIITGIVVAMALLSILLIVEMALLSILLILGNEKRAEQE